MRGEEITRAADAATAVAVELGLSVDDAIVLWNSNKLAVHLVPCDVFARVARLGEEVAHFEVELAQRLAEVDAPIAALAPQVEPRVYQRDSFAITLWTYYESPASESVPVAEYAKALERLHAGMRKVDTAAPHFTDRIAEAQAIVASADGSPVLDDADRTLVGDALRTGAQTIAARAAPEQLLHGEPHPGNLLDTRQGLLFIDLETCCRGPVEFDLAHLPEAVSDCYVGADRDLLHDCRGLVLAMVAAWRCEPDDQLPNRERALLRLLDALRAGPPWPALDAVMP